MNDDGDARGVAGLHAQEQRPDKGVVARANVLEVDQKGVEAVEHRCGRFAVFAVERVDRDAEPGVWCALPLDHVVLRGAGEPVLRAEQGAEF